MGMYKCAKCEGYKDADIEYYKSIYNGREICEECDDTERKETCCICDKELGYKALEHIEDHNMSTCKDCKPVWLYVDDLLDDGGGYQAQYTIEAVGEMWGWDEIRMELLACKTIEGVDNQVAKWGDDHEVIDFSKRAYK